MKKLHWCTQASDHAYMKMRRSQNWEIAKISKAETWMRDKLKTYDLKFARQTQWGMRLFDFWNAHLGIAIEVDGPEHDASYDAYRDEYNFRRSGILVLRVRNFNESDAELAIRIVKSEISLKDRKIRLGIAGPLKNTKKVLVEKPYPPSLLIEYLQSHHSTNGTQSGVFFNRS